MHRITEFHNIMPISNMPSVMQHGILSHDRCASLPHEDISLQSVQDKRYNKRVPGGHKLHRYANLYFHARNPMMFKRKDQAEALCVLRVRKDVMELDGVVISDQNAASDWARFYTPAELESLDMDAIYARDWRHPGEQIAYFRHKSIKCAEVLVYNCINAQYIIGAYVASDNAATKLRDSRFDKEISVEPDLFFRES